MLAVRTPQIILPETSRLPTLALVVSLHVAFAWMLLLTPAREVIRVASVTMVSPIREQRMAEPSHAPVPTTPLARTLRLTAEVPPTPAIVIAAGEASPTTPAGATASRAATAISRETAEPRIEPPQFDLAYLRNPPPAYPSLSKRLREQGRVLLRVRVSADGTAEQIEIQASSGTSRLDSAAIEAVRQWRFVPARRGVDAVIGWALVPINFQLS